jgi:sugar lactone lactonase YvrE
VSAAPSVLLLQVRHALVQAGFHLVGEAEGGQRGLVVRDVPTGVLVRWTASDGFTSLAVDQRGDSGGGVQAIVQAAVSGLLVQLGHTVTEPSDGGLLVLADESRASRDARADDHDGARPPRGGFSYH